MPLREDDKRPRNTVLATLSLYNIPSGRRMSAVAQRQVAVEATQISRREILMKTNKGMRKGRRYNQYKVQHHLI